MNTHTVPDYDCWYNESEGKYNILNVKNALNIPNTDKLRKHCELHSM